MKTLVTEQTFKFGQTNIIPHAGAVNISATGTIEVEDDIAQLVVDSDCGFSFSKSTAETTTTTTQEQTTTTTTAAVETTTTTTVDEINLPKGDDLGGDDSKDSLEGNDNKDNLEDQIAATTTTTTIIVSDEDAKAELHKHNLTQLKELAKDFPSAEWRTLNKEELVNYIVSKLK